MTVYQITLDDSEEADRLLDLLQRQAVVKSVEAITSENTDQQARRKAIRAALLGAPEWSDEEAASWEKVQEARQNWKSTWS